jgi:hypothetical protein
MAKKPRPKLEIELDWYYISKESVRKWLVAFLLVAGGVVWGVHALLSRGEDVTRRAQREIANGEELIARCKTLPEAGRLKDEMEVAIARIIGAKMSLAKGRPTESISQALDAQSIARQMLGGLSMLRGDANIVDTGGKVEVQRASRATWEAAKVGMRLFDGDFLKTGPTGLAEVMSADGTLYRIKPETLFEVRHTTTLAGAAPGEERHRSEIKLVVGVIDTNTGEGTRSIVKTDAVVADIASKSSVGVDVDTSRATGVSTYRGSATLSTEKGGKVTLAEHERVVASARGGGFGPKIRLPDTPAPAAPDNNVVLDLARAGQVSIRWSRVPEATRYRLQIARSRLFIPDSIIVDLNDRQKTEAVVTVTEEGSFFWRVAALTKANLASEWSAARRFKVVSGNASGSHDKRPPDLRLERSKVIGNLVMVSGKTEPGAMVTVNGEPADLDSTGAFRKMISMDRDGLSTIIVKATDGSGNETVRKENVFIQTN